MKSHIAEYVSPGHPDRLADRIVESIVDAAVAQDFDALVGIECAVHTDHVMMISNDHSVIGDCPHLGGQFIIISEDRSAVSVTTQVLGREERGAAYMSDGTGLLGLSVGEGVSGTDGLTGVFHYKQIVLLGQRH